MIQILIGTALIFILIGGYTYIVLPAKDWRRIAGPIMLVIVFLAQSYVALLGLGKPMPSGIKSYGDYQVYSFWFAEPKEIDLWIFKGHDLLPTYIALPWDAKLAQALMDQFEKAAKTHEIVRMSDGDMMPYLFKMKSLPDKEGN